MSIDIEMPEITTRDEAERYAASLGIALSPSDLKNIAKSEEAKRDSYISDPVEDGSQRVLTVLESIEAFSEILFTLVRAIILAFGVPVSLILLLIVEQQRVVHGMYLFETNENLASFAAWSIVILNLVLEFTIEYVEYRNNYKPVRNIRFSLLSVKHNLEYLFGFQKNWEPQELSPAHRYKMLLRLITLTILSLALAGSMKEVVSDIEGPWFDGIVSIITQSDLLQMLTWVGGLLFAAVAVLSVQGLSRYVAIWCEEIVGNMQAKRDQGNGIVVNDDSVAIQYILSKVAKNQARQNEKNSSADFLAMGD